LSNGFVEFPYFDLMPFAGVNVPPVDAGDVDVRMFVSDLVHVLPFFGGCVPIPRDPDDS
jgi:hypothetical protein